MVEVGLRLHPDKTRIVYCKDGKRRGDYAHTSFTFLGFTFRPRGVRTKTGRMFVSFTPAISKDALTKIGRGPIFTPARRPGNGTGGSRQSCGAARDYEVGWSPAAESLRGRGRDQCSRTY
jgi:hypothetical protein